MQTGGPSGGCIPEQFLDMPVDYESLAKVGSIMGSGGMIVMDETSCMVDVAKFFMEFCMRESCGKCVPCRVGTAQMYDLLCKHQRQATRRRDDLALLEDLCDMVKNTSLCGLGQTAPNPVLSTLRYFRDEYLSSMLREALSGTASARQKHETAEVTRMSRPRVTRRHASRSTTRTSSAREDQTILEVARENGIDIPTLCHLEG